MENILLFGILGFYSLSIVGGIILFAIKIAERRKEKREEDLDKYKKY